MIDPDNPYATSSGTIIDPPVTAEARQRRDQRFGLIVAVVVVVISALVLDFGEMLRRAMIAVLIWVGIVAVMQYRARPTSRWDRIVTRWGPLLVLVGIKLAEWGVSAFKGT
ncbi:MAG: hypothetical protein SGJ20_02430 [Planctomycetota bacterium]|nr:hypothetical protein [Planctomycetota bacterium]